MMSLDLQLPNRELEDVAESLVRYWIRAGKLPATLAGVNLNEDQAR